MILLVWIIFYGWADYSPTSGTSGMKHKVPREGHLVEKGSDIGGIVELKPAEVDVDKAAHDARFRETHSPNTPTPEKCGKEEAWDTTVHADVKVITEEYDTG